ncbi:MAG: DUF1667 domain-containing protein [Clostridia bacterium]|nr:DUF1667 domain-containing protein [Clostridia bacterium]
MQEKIITCTECPMGCSVTVTLDGERVINVVGNTCPRGKTYAINEVSCPRRVVTTTVKTDKGNPLAVKTDGSIKKSEIFNVMKIINGITVKTPIKIGDVIYENISEDINLVASDEIE